MRQTHSPKANRKPRTRPFGRRALLPLGLLAAALACGVANSQALYDVFAARWPSNALPRGSDTNAVRTIAYTSQYSSQMANTSSNARLPPQAARMPPKTELLKFASAPFPYDGMVPGTGRPFLDVEEGGQKGHRTARGSVLWQRDTFNDNRVLLHIPSGFDINRPAVMVVYFHGHGADLTRDVLHRQKLPEQISLSGMNAVLVAPQFAVDAADSSAGHFWQPGAFARFVGEAGKKLASLNGNPAKARTFATMPVIIVAYSGGYLPAAWSIRNGGLGRRVHGLVLLDGLYGEIDDFARWIKKSKSAFFVSAYTRSTRRQNLALANILSEHNVRYSTDIGKHLWHGGVALLPMDSAIRHRDFVTQAWTDYPVADILSKLN